MIDFESATDKFWPYLNNQLGVSMLKRGLKPDAPVEAIEQYEKFKKMYEDAEKDGIEI